MPVYREKVVRQVRSTRGEGRREGDRPIITQTKPSKKPETRRKPDVNAVGDEKKKDQVAAKSQRSRTRTRTLSPTEVKQMTRERIAREYGPAAAGMISSQREQSPIRNDTDDYEDDFEDYESDFEEESEEEKAESEEPKVVTPEPVPVPKTEIQKRELDEIRLAIKLENDLTKSRMKTPDIPEAKPPAAPTLDFSKSKRKSEADKAAEKARRRGRDLLSMITLDAISYSFLDVPSIPYDVYMKMYGKSNTKQVHVQTNEDDTNEETQTTPVEVQNKWVQYPTDALGKMKWRLTKETLAHNQEIRTLCCVGRIYLGPTARKTIHDLFPVNQIMISREKLGVGGDDATEPEPVMEVTDITRLNEFLDWASDILIPALQKTGNFLGGDKLQNQSNMQFSDGFVTPNVSDLPFLKGKAVTVVSYIPEEVSTILTVHTDPMMSFGESVICVWSITDLSKPAKVLTASNMVTSVCGVAQGLVFGGEADGTVCSWDLKESSALHHGTGDTDWVIRSPTYSTAQLANGHVSSVMSVHVLREGNEPVTGDFTPMQVCSLEEKGMIIIWSVVQGRNLSSDEDLGLAHWGKVKLVKSSMFSVMSALGKDPPPYVTFNALAIEQSDNVEMYVTNSLGSVSHISRYGTCMKPKAYKDRDLAETTCLEICPFDPNYFLTGCNNGSIRLHCRSQELPLISLNASTGDDSPQASIVDLAWLYVRPFVFFALDSLSRIHIWDLGLSDMYPAVTLNLTKKKITSLKLIQSRDNKQRPHFVLGTKDAKIEIHRLKSDYSNRPTADIQKDIKKFLKYRLLRSVSSSVLTTSPEHVRLGSIYKLHTMILDWLRPLQECNTLACAPPSKTPICRYEDLDEVLILESKVVSAMMRLQKRGGSGLQPQQIVEFLSMKHRHLDGDIESQVITALQSGVRKGFICGLSNGKYTLIGPNPRKMATNCYNGVKHGPKCSCFIITAGKRRCCAFRYNSRCLFVKDPSLEEGERRPRRKCSRAKRGCNDKSLAVEPGLVTKADCATECQRKRVTFCTAPAELIS